MSEHLIELLIIASNLFVALPTAILAFVTVFTVEKDRRVEMLYALHVRAREGASGHIRRIGRVVRRKRTVSEEISAED